MKVAVIGPDNSGKTTLITKLSEHLGWDIVKSLGGIPPHIGNKDKIVDQMVDVLINNDGPVLMDRLAWIDDQVYGPILRDGSLFGVHDLYQKMVSDNVDMMIYCRPPRSFMMNFGEREQLPGVREKGIELINAYDDLIFRLQGLPEFRAQVMVYDHTSDNGEVIEALIDYLKVQSEEPMESFIDHIVQGILEGDL